MLWLTVFFYYYVDDTYFYSALLNIQHSRLKAKREENQNVQIHDYFANLEAQDSGKERQIKHDKNLVSCYRVTLLLILCVRRKSS